MFTYFLFTPPSNLEDVKSSTEFLEKFEPLLGYQIPLVALNGLLSLLEFNDVLEKVFEREGANLHVYKFPSSFPSKLLAYGNDHLEVLAARWAKEEYWEFVEVNPFDLYGIMIELKGACMDSNLNNPLLAAITGD